jgi:ATP-dependent Clp protease ATP-binding subunit ClpB
MIVLTSNLGAEILVQAKPGDDQELLREKVMQVVRGAFRPEFLNRLDEIILFHHLSREHMDGIVTIQLARLEARLLDRHISLSLSQEAQEWLANRGYDPVFGARPLKRLIQRELQNPLASALLQGTIQDGDTVVVSVTDDRLSFMPERGKKKAA